jgi:hypothetical protein
MLNFACYYWFMKEERECSWVRFKLSTVFKFYVIGNSKDQYVTALSSAQCLSSRITIENTTRGCRVFRLTTAESQSSFNGRV